MDTRFDLFGSELMTEFFRRFNAASQVATESALPKTKVFTEPERAALALAEEGTRLADAATGVSDETWQAARKHFDDEQLAALITVIAVINTWNRLNVISGTPAGDYQPGQFA